MVSLGLTEMSTRNISWGVRAALPPSCADCLEIWEPQPPGTAGSVLACTGIALPLLYHFILKEKCNVGSSVCMLHLSSVLAHKRYLFSCYLSVVTSSSSFLFNKSVLLIIAVVKIIVSVCFECCFVFDHTLNRRESCRNTV
jgi:hypothetical protein